MQREWSHIPTPTHLGSTGESDWPLLAGVSVERQGCFLNIQQVKPVKTLESDLVWIGTWRGGWWWWGSGGE